MALPEDFPDLDVFHANAVNYLIQGDEKESAILLLSCSVRLRVGLYQPPTPQRRGEIRIELTGSRKVYETFAEDTSEREQLWNAFGAVKPLGYFLTDISVRVETVTEVDKDWRQEMQAQLSGKEVTNQGVEIPNRDIFLWNGLRFRSPHEVRIAAALDAAGVMFLPNCRGRLGPKDAGGGQTAVALQRVTREADFLVCANGKWGVLEVDGSQHEGAAAKDHERDRLFKYHGIRVAERFTAKECFNDAPGVVRRFLTLLAQIG